MSYFVVSNREPSSGSPVASSITSMKNGAVSGSRISASAVEPARTSTRQEALHAQSMYVPGAMWAISNPPSDPVVAAASTAMSSGRSFRSSHSSMFQSSLRTADTWHGETGVPPSAETTRPRIPPPGERRTTTGSCDRTTRKEAAPNPSRRTTTWNACPAATASGTSNVPSSALVVRRVRPVAKA